MSVAVAAKVNFSHFVLTLFRNSSHASVRAFSFLHCVILVDIALDAPMD